ncbi:MAG: adenylate/guanylate cyclase domain-containing protein [Geminicoccaceae bacterium]|nr:adenylate/guanylate cyclase domain-containing protein [Geminicoccaceae bacterium]
MKGWLAGAWWPHLSMASTLALVFGGLLTLALGLTLLIGLYVAGTNTRELLAARTNLTLEAVQTGVAGHLEPVEAALEQVRARLASGDDATLAPFIQGVLAAVPQVNGIAIVERDGRVRGFAGVGARTVAPERIADLAGLDKAFEALGRHDTVVWGEPVWSPDLKTTVINARLTLRRPGAPEAMLVAAVRLETFIAYLNELSRQIGQPVFVLHGRRQVVGYTGFRPETADLSADRPLPFVEEVKDPVLAAIWSGDRDALDLIGDLIIGKAHEVRAFGRPYIFVYRAMQGYTDLPWLVGTYLPSRLLSAPVERLIYLGLFALMIVLAAMLAVFRLGRRLARPVERLALQADRIRALELDGLEPLTLSHVVELDRAARAFNAMAGAMGLIQAYLPRRVVRRLVRLGPAACASEERRVTVMFTDIVGFSALAAGRTAQETADLLNAHFTLLEGCIDRFGGTIDKYVGDSVMAFWGAPGDGPDHAAQAARAALAIRDALAEARAEGRAEGDVPIRIGLHTGSVLVGNIGAARRLDYTLVGETVNVAQHVEQLGRDLEDDERTRIVMSAATAEAIEAHDPALAPRPRGLFWLKGRTAQVEVFTL